MIHTHIAVNDLREDICKGPRVWILVLVEG